MQIDECLAIRDGRLHVEGCDAGELADRFGTPLYVVSEDQLRRRARAFARAFEAAWPHGPARVLPSIKANYALALRAVLSDEGLGCDAFGAGELEAALRAGTPPALVSLERLLEGPDADRARGRRGRTDHRGLDDRAAAGLRDRRAPGPPRAGPRAHPSRTVRRGAV